jgi:hypothetical protein
MGTSHFLSTTKCAPEIGRRFVGLLEVLLFLLLAAADLGCAGLREAYERRAQCLPSRVGGAKVFVTRRSSGTRKKKIGKNSAYLPQARCGKFSRSCEDSSLVHATNLFAHNVTLLRNTTARGF